MNSCKSRRSELKFVSNVWATCCLKYPTSFSANDCFILKVISFQKKTRFSNHVVKYESFLQSHYIAKTLVRNLIIYQKTSRLDFRIFKIRKSQIRRFPLAFYDHLLFRFECCIPYIPIVFSNKTSRNRSKLKIQT